ncbi:MAG: hypothetical protein DRJ13_13145 [Bacteroidetes bacterium]|nr:MAG: hypothetical protein DRJ13_13145 [Bacteroidota bacterium]
MVYLTTAFMKVYSISKWAFRGICVLILLLPVSRHWQLLTTGGKAVGTVTQYTSRIVEDIMGERDLQQASEIEFIVDGVSHKTYGPKNFEYDTGRTLKVFYLRKDPSHNCVATFSGFYLTYYTVLPTILLTVWYAFYLSFNNYRRRMKKPKGQSKPHTVHSSLLRKDADSLSR